MQNITFPLFNLNLSINRVAIQIAGVPIYWYAVFITVAIVIGILLLQKKEGLFGISFASLFDLILITIPLAIIGARAYYVLFEWDYYSQNLGQIFQLRDGGLAIYGGIIVGVSTIYFYCRKKKWKVLDVLDYIVPVLALGQAIRTLGEFL